MDMKFPNYVSAVGIYYPRELSIIRKSEDIHQPIFEAVTNSWEAIVDKYGIDNMTYGKINISIYSTKSLEMGDNTTYGFEKVVISDNGIGLDSANLERLKNLRDPSKNHSNNGTGRVQFLKFFHFTSISSVHQNDDGHHLRTDVTLSSDESFLANKAILRIDDVSQCESSETGTVVTFFNPIDKTTSDYYSTINSDNLKTFLIKHSLARFCDNRDALPEMTICRYVNGTIVDSTSIVAYDIPSPIHEDPICINYSRVDGKKIISIDKEEKFILRTFIEPSHSLERNTLYLVSKGELGSTLPIVNLTEKDIISGNRYLFLLSGKYLDSCDSDDRGNIRLVDAKDFKKRNDNPAMFLDEVVLKDNIEEKVNDKISETCKEIAIKEDEKQAHIDELKEMFLLDPDTVEQIRKKIKKNDSDAEILSMVYKGEMDKIAEQDAKIKEKVKAIESLDPSKPNYQSELQIKVDEFTEIIPEQNRTALSKYVARRKLVLDIFEKILSKELDCLKGDKRIDEKLLHNLIFSQKSDDPEMSDMWLVDDQFLYFHGCSEPLFNNIEIDGVRLLKTNLSEEESAYKFRNGKDVGIRRPDIFLYPEEGKCIFIEFKAPDVDVSDHLDQINMYSMMLNNLSDDSFHFHTFYGYLIGENIDYLAIEEKNSDFKEASNLGYIVRPSYKIPGRFGRPDGDLYTEIIKYSDLLKRASNRNKVFIDKLEGKSR